MSSTFGRPDVAALGDTFLVVARPYGYTPQVITMIGARVRGADGVVLDPAPRQLGGGYVRSIAIAPLGDRWISALISNWSHDESGADTGIGFVAADGTVSGSSGVYIFSTAGGNGIHELALASSGSVALLTQSAEITSGVETDLIGWLIQPSGAASAMLNFTHWREDQYRPPVAWDGGRFVIVYQDQRNAFAYNSLEQLDARSDLLGMRVMPDGAILDPQGFVFAAARSAESHPNIAAAGGRTLVLGSIFRPETGTVAYRIGYSQYGSNQWPVVTASRVTVNGGVTVKDQLGNAVASATVYATWTRPDGSTAGQSAATNTSGVANFSTSGGRGAYTLTVTNIAKTGYVFDPANSVLSKSITR